MPQGGLSPVALQAKRMAGGPSGIGIDHVRGGAIRRAHGVRRGPQGGSVTPGISWVDGAVGTQVYAILTELIRNPQIVEHFSGYDTNYDTQMFDTLNIS